MYLCKYFRNPLTGSKVKSARKADIYNLYRMVTLTIRSRPPKSNQPFIVSQPNNVIVSPEFKEIRMIKYTYVNPSFTIHIKAGLNGV